METSTKTIENVSAEVKTVNKETVKKVTAKKPTIKKKTTVKKETSKTPTIKKASTKKISKASTELIESFNSHLYKVSIYTDDKGEFISDKKKQKACRTKQRKQLEKFYSDICVTQRKDKELQKKSIAKFNTFYKKYYKLNDYSVQSIYANSNPSKMEELNELLKIVTSSRVKK